MDKEVKSRDDQIHKLRQEVLVYTDENNRLKELSSVSNKFLEEDLKKAKSECEELKKSNADLLKELTDTKESLKETMETMTAFKNEAKDKITNSKAMAEEARKAAKLESEKSDRLSTMLHSMEEKLKKAELDKSQQIGSLTENIGVHTQQLNKRVDECNRLRSDLATAKTHNESLQETVDKLKSHIDSIEKKSEEQASTLQESLHRLQVTEEELLKLNKMVMKQLIYCKSFIQRLAIKDNPISNCARSCTKSHKKKLSSKMLPLKSWRFPNGIRTSLTSYKTYLASKQS